MALNGIASCENTFAIFREWFVICDICDLWMLVWLPQEIQEISNNFLLVLVQWHIFFSIYGLSDGWLEKVSFLSLNMTYFPILGKDICHTYSFNYYNRISPKQDYPHIKIFQWSPLIPFYLDPFYPSRLPLLQHTYTSSSTPLWLRIKEYWVFAHYNHV